jgi:hypothetical protein
MTGAAIHRPHAYGGAPDVLAVLLGEVGGRAGRWMAALRGHAFGVARALAHAAAGAAARGASARAHCGAAARPAAAHSAACRSGAASRATRSARR